MAEVKHQKIIVFLSFTETDKNLILNGIRIASIFKKELCLCYNYPKKAINHKEQFKEKITSYLNPIKNELPLLKVSTLLLSEKPNYLPEKLADDFEAILMIADSNDFKKHKKALTESPIPYLFINGENDIISEFKKLIVPIDFRKENHDCILWSSYFGRFNSSGIIVLAANDNGKDEQRQVAVNIALCKKLFQKFSIEHKFFRGRKSSLNNSFEAHELALSSKSDLLIILGSSVITPLDSLIGLPEMKIVKKSPVLPVLVINSIKDNYILCD